MKHSYQIKGINSDSDTCEVCGKTDLKKVVWLVEVDEDGNETENLKAYGTSCASRKLGFNSKATKNQKETFILEALQDEKKRASIEYFKNECNKVPFGNSAVYIDKKYRIGLIMKETGKSRDEVINEYRQKMKKENWFLT